MYCRMRRSLMIASMSLQIAFRVGPGMEGTASRSMTIEQIPRTTVKNAGNQFSLRPDKDNFKNISQDRNRAFRSLIVALIKLGSWISVFEDATKK